MNKKQKLNQCKKCGEEEYISIFNSVYQGFYVSCRICDFRTLTRKTRKEAIDVWNAQGVRK